MCGCVCVCVCAWVVTPMASEGESRVTSGACMRVLLFCDRTLGAATYPSVMMAMSVRRHTKVLAIGEG